MIFDTIKEYFYKLYNRCYVLVLLPLAVFIYLYFQLRAKKILPLIQDEFLIQMSALALGLISAANLTTVHWVSRKRLKMYSLEVGLGHKLDRYAEIISLRFGAGSASSLMMALGVLFTGSEFFSLFFALILIWMAFQWPTSKRACRDLALKGDEYKMVFFKKEKL